MRLLFFLEVVALFLVLPLWGTQEEMLQEANASYQQGENATSFEERRLAFNRALHLFSLLEEKTPSPTPALNRAIGDSYFQLGEYAWAILYYQRAFKTDPHDPLLIDHLSKAQQKLGLPIDSSSHQDTIKPILKLSKQYELFFWIFLLTFLICSTLIWFPFSWSFKCAISSIFLLFLSLGGILFSYYSTPIEGILVTSTGFYRAPDWNQPQLTNYPLLAGSKVKILQMTSEGNWLKITNATDLIGYIPTAALRLI
jgi:tetratricopeptide (TPR) repeat protein